MLNLNKSKLIDLLTELRGFKFVTAIVLVSQKIESDDKAKYGIFHSNSKSKIVINESKIDNVFN